MGRKKTQTKEIVSNPNGANQYKIDPRQSVFLKYYLDPKSKTFSNAYKSALKAGYSKEYAEVIVGQMPKWLSEFLGDISLLDKAERNIKEFLEMEITNTGVTKDGKEIYEYDDTGKLKVKADISKFVAERLGKMKWSQRYEFGDDEITKEIEETRQKLKQWLNV